MQPTTFFSDAFAPTGRTLPTLGTQKDITYFGTTVRGLLNSPEATGMGYWSVNPYVGCAFGCAYCYARYAHRYTVERAAAAAEIAPGIRQQLAELPPWLAFERRILVKQGAREALRRQLRPTRRGGPKAGETIVVGTATDPYQPAERRYRVTRGVLETLAEHPGIDVVVITKSPLITRDIDVLARLVQRGRLSIHISLITLDRDLARTIEPRAPTPEARVRALERLREAGIPAGINVMPVLPGITDAPAALEALVQRVAEAGATYVSACALRLRADARRRYLPLIEREFPHLAARYRASYASGHHVSERYRAGLSAFFAGLRTRYGLPGTVYEAGDDEDDDESPGARGDPELVAQLQLSL